MKRHLNLLALFGFLLCALGTVGYVPLFVPFPSLRDTPWLSWLLIAAGLGSIAFGLTRAFRWPDRYRGRIAGPIFGLLSLALAGMFGYATLVATREVPASTGAPKIGQVAPDFTLPDSNGRATALKSLLGPGKPWVLLIFYRGYW